MNRPAMGVARRFLNLIVDSEVKGGKSLHCIDLVMGRNKLFNTKSPVLPPPKGNRSESESERPPQDNRKNYRRAAASSSVSRKIREIELPQPVMNFRCSTAVSRRYCYWNMNCLPLAGRKVLCVDSSYRTVLFDVKTRQVETIPYFHVAKHEPLPCFVPLPSSAAADDGNGSFYILEGRPDQEELQGDDEQLSNQYEAFVYNSESKSWRRRLLPPPPFVRDPKQYETKHYEYYTRGPKITSYAVVQRDGSHVIYVSADGAGTYCLDTVTHTWSHVGDWVLPFTGKVEYVPELKLWFGICTKDWQLGAADLSTMDSQSQPQIVGTWKELEAPAFWGPMTTEPPQLVSLGSGRFCITRFFFQVVEYPSGDLVDPMGMYSNYEDPVDEEYFTVFTGVDVVPCIQDAHGTASDTISGGNGSEGKVKLQMIKHNSRRHMTYGSDHSNIENVF